MKRNDRREMIDEMKVFGSVTGRAFCIMAWLRRRVDKKGE